MNRWTTENIPDQTGRVALVTGANTGIGFETAGALARKGATVLLACRNRERGEAAVQRIQQENPQASLALQELDLSDLRSVTACAQRLLDQLTRLDLLILNAGVMVPPASRTEQGYELQFGVNHLGHFALTGALLPLLHTTHGCRVVVVSSTAALRGEMRFDDLHFETRGYAPWPAYSQSKLANQLFARELQRRLQDAGSPILVTAAHPGWTATDLQRTASVARFFTRLVAMPAAQGALPTLRAAVDPEAQGADYFGPDGLLQMRGYPKRIDMVKRAYDADDARRLWEVSEELTGVHYAFVDGAAAPE